MNCDTLTLIIPGATVHWGPGSANNCWPHIHLSADRDEWSYCPFSCMSSHSAIVGFLDRSYCYILAASKFLMMLEWHESHILVKNVSSTEDQTNTTSHSMSSKQHILNCVTTVSEFNIRMHTYCIIFLQSWKMTKLLIINFY